MLFERIDRVVTLVPDLEAAEEFFSRVFGLRFDETAVDEDLQLKLVHAGRFGLELIEPTGDEQPRAASMRKWLQKHGPGFRTIVIKVSDLDAALARLREHGIEPVGQFALGEAREAFLDPSQTMNISIALNEYPEEHPMTIEGRSAHA
jgi:catechol 2,3-dioxygenase-like lactoylglutathione lyase family enzyme